MVNESDAIIAIEGHKATRKIIDLAWIYKNLYFLPFTGGNSREGWNKYCKELSILFNMSEEEKSLPESGSADFPITDDVCLSII